MPERTAPLNAHEVAGDVAAELRQLYGERVQAVLLFGSWARGDAHRDSDIDLLVVLDQVESPWAERERMSEILWRHSFENDTVITALAVSGPELESGDEPLLIRARAEGIKVA